MRRWRLYRFAPGPPTRKGRLRDPGFGPEGAAEAGGSREGKVSRNVVAKIVGGIGNQLFCYAAARRLALRNDASLCLDLDFFRSDINFSRSFRLDSFELPPHETLKTRGLLPPRLDLYAWRLRRRVAMAGLLPGRDWLIEALPGKFEAHVLNARVSRTTMVDGYWQDERYFADIAAVLRRDLTFRPEVGTHLRDLEARITSSNSVAVHSRRLHGVTPSNPAGARDALDANYYLKAIEAIAGRVARPEFFCFGDDPRWLVEQWPRTLPVTVVHDSGPRGDVTDLWLMSKCRHFVVANSSFSWWGAWLGADPAKIAIAPRSKGLEYEVRSAAGWIEIDW